MRLRGRRRHNRRLADQSHGYYVDRYEAGWIAAAVAIMVFGCIDGWTTLYLLQHGAREANPLMEMLLSRNPGLFVGVKMALTSVGVMIMICHCKFRILRGLPGSRLLLISLVLYAVLVGFELRLLA